MLYDNRNWWYNNNSNQLYNNSNWLYYNCNKINFFVNKYVKFCGTFFSIYKLKTHQKNNEIKNKPLNSPAIFFKLRE